MACSRSSADAVLISIHILIHELLSTRTDHAQFGACGASETAGYWACAGWRAHYGSEE